MIKVSSVILFLSLFQFAIGQTSAVQLTEIDSVNKSNYLAQVFPLDDYCIFVDYEVDTIVSFLKNHSNYFSFYTVDVEDTVIVFDGKLCGGHELGLVNVYRLENGKPHSIMSRSGEIAEIRGSEILIYTYPCCSAVLNIITPFSLLTGERTGDSHVFYSREDFDAVFNSISKKVKKEIRLTEDSEIRFSASSTEERMTPACDNNYSNIIGSINKGCTGQLIKKSDNNWALIRLDAMITSQGYCLREYYQKLIGSKKYILYGWIEMDSIEKE